VSERNFKKGELIKAIHDKRLYEGFLSGTAAVIAPIGLLNIDGTKYDIPYDKSLNSGKLTYELYNDLFDIQYGIKPHPYSIVVD